MEEKIYQLLDLIKKNGDACPDFAKKMRGQGYGEDKIVTFATHWVNGVEALQKPCNSPIYIYLFD